jgi:hypothetical protein
MGEEGHEKKGAREDKDGAFKVTDRRHFTSEGDLRREIPDEETREEKADEKRPEGTGTPEGAGGGFERRPLDEPEGVDFTMLVNAMAQPALLFLGEIPHPGTGDKKVDLEQAKIQVDLLDLLRVKSRGNLTSQEEGLLERVLYELRMLYVARSNRPG